uniref:Tyrosine-protein kinase-like otk n=1 Tax=Anopheles minimus TaxID=112268 RepID=A0A182WF85_9DIPT
MHKTAEKKSRISSPVVQLLKHDPDRGSISLKCHSSQEAVSEPLNGDGKPSEETHVEWYRNEQKLTKSSPHIELQRRKLHIKNASAKDNGVYSCLLVVVSRTDGSRRIALRSTKNYRLKLKPGTNYGDGKIDCTKNHNVLLCRGKRGDRQLGSLADEAMVPAQLQLATERQPSGPVRIVLHPVTTVVNESQPVVFNCGFRITGNDSTGGGGFVLRWRKDGKVIRRWDNMAETTTTVTMDEMAGATESSSMFRDDARIHVDRTNGSLVFGSVVASDEGTYDCQITNNASDFLVSSTAAELQIISNLRFTPKPPTSKNLELGSIAKIHCKAQGTPTPTVHWTVVTEAGPTGLPDSIEDVNGTLVFRNVSAEHRGSYACVASNSQGEIRASVSVNVVIAPKFEIAPEGSVQVAELGTVQFHCVATGDPKPTIQWDKDLQYLHGRAGNANGSEEERYRILENGTLVLTEVHLEDDGRYGCTIGNSAGLKREEVHLIVKPSDGIAMPEESTEDGFLITRAVLITMSVAFAYIILVVGLMIWCRHRRAARKARLNLGSSKENGGDVDLKNCEIEPCLPDKTSAAGAENGAVAANAGRSRSKQKNGSAGGKDPSSSNCQENGQDKSDDTVNSSKSKKSSGSGSLLEQLAVPRSAVVELLQIGKCDFGDVYIGKMRENDCRLPPPKESATLEPIAGDEVGAGSSSAEVTTENERKSPVSKRPSNEELNAIRPENDYKPVMVKALTKVKDEHCCAEFRRQLELFRTVSHRNVVQLFGLCRDKDPHYLLLEYTDWGDLKQFLLATSPVTPPNGTVDNKKDTATKPPPLNTSCWSVNPKERPSFSQLVVAIGNCLQSEYPKEPAE